FSSENDFSRTIPAPLYCKSFPYDSLIFQSDSQKIRRIQHICPRWNKQVYISPRRCICFGTDAAIYSREHRSKSLRIIGLTISYSTKHLGCYVFIDSEIPSPLSILEYQTSIGGSALILWHPTKKSLPRKISDINQVHWRAGILLQCRYFHFLHRIIF